MAGGMSRAWRFNIGVFEESPLSPRVYPHPEKIYMEEVGPEDNGLPPFPASTGQFRAAMERYSDDAVVVCVRGSSGSTATQAGPTGPPIVGWKVLSGWGSNTTAHPLVYLCIGEQQLCPLLLLTQ